MKKIWFWTMATLSGLVLLFSYHTSTNQPVAIGSTSTTSSGSGSSAKSSSGSGSSSSDSESSSGSGDDSNSSASSTPSPSASASSGSSSTGLKNGTYTGSTAQTRWGPVQVRITVSGGKITASDAIQHPSGNGQSDSINAQAVPVLNSATITAQSASIDMVGGATYTSMGYKQSLQSAIDQANQ